MNEVTKLAPQAPAAADNMVSMIERVAMNADLPIERLEQMLAMKERMDAKAAEKAFAAAFAAASAEFPAVPLRGKGHNQKPYATLKDIISATRPVLSDHGLSLTWNVSVSDKMVTVTASLKHVDGHAETTAIALPSDNSGSKNPVQAFGSTQTYGQRYTAQAILGLALGEDADDDGKASGAGSTVSADQFRDLQSLIEQASADEGKLCAMYGVETLHDLPAVNFTAAKAMLKTKIRGAAK